MFISIILGLSFLGYLFCTVHLYTLDKIRAIKDYPELASTKKLEAFMFLTPITNYLKDENFH